MVVDPSPAHGQRYPPAAVSGSCAAPGRRRGLEAGPEGESISAGRRGVTYHRAHGYDDDGGAVERGRVRSSPRAIDRTRRTRPTAEGRRQLPERPTPPVYPGVLPPVAPRRDGERSGVGVSFYVRKSVSAGPFRFNLSKSGIGVSTGIPGFRVGTGPRGAYVRMGRGGVYYRSTLSSGSSRPGGRGRSGRTSRPAAAERAAPSIDATDVVMHEVPTASVVEVAASNSSELLTDLNAAASRRSIWPIVLVLTACGATAAVRIIPLLIAILVVGLPATAWLSQRDRARKRTVVFYDVTDEHAARYQNLVDGCSRAISSQRAWRVVSRGNLRTTQQRKTHAGVNTIVGRVPLRRSLGGPPALATNIAVPSFESSKESLYLLPDRALLRTGRRYADLPFDAISARASTTVFVEDGPVPRDANVVGSTWQFVNVKGGPDRRYKNNKKLPRLQYGELVLTGPAGLQLQWQFSLADAAQSLAHALVKPGAPPPPAAETRLRGPGDRELPTPVPHQSTVPPRPSSRQRAATPRLRPDRTSPRPAAPRAASLSVQQVGTLLDLTNEQVLRLVVDGVLPSHEFGSATMIDAAHLAAYIRRMAAEGSAPEIAADATEVAASAKSAARAPSLDLRQASVMLGATNEEVLRLALDGVLPSRQVGSSTRLDAHGIAAYLRLQGQRPQTDESP